MEKEKILIVEDSKFQGIIVKDMLIKNNYSATWVDSAEEAMKHNLWELFDLILLDVVLPRMNGYEFCEFIKKKQPLIPVVMVTSMDDDKSVVKALNAGADDYIKKPYSFDELLARIKVQLRTRKLQLELIKKNNELQQAYETIKILAATDMLTGAYNRGYLTEYLQKIFEGKENKSIKVACIMIDIDHFKKINDTYGHLIGDVVLTNLSEICKNYVKDNGAVIRFGGEEFLIIIHKNVDRVYDIAESIRRDCEESMCCGFKFTVSLGINEFTLNKDTLISDFQKGLKEADKMLYISKNTGRNRVTIKRIHTA
jgi:two-component system cell cycle response regulator